MLVKVLAVGVSVSPFIRSFVPSWAPGGPWNLSALQPLAAWRGGGIQGPRGAGGLAQAVKVRPLVRGGGEGATPPKGHLGAMRAKGALGTVRRLGRCADAAQGRLCREQPLLDRPARAEEGRTWVGLGLGLGVGLGLGLGLGLR